MSRLHAYLNHLPGLAVRVLAPIALSFGCNIGDEFKSVTGWTVILFSADRVRPLESMTLQGDLQVQRDNVLVAVRVRSEKNHESIIDISGADLTLHPPKSGGINHRFGFDRCYSNFGDSLGSQEDVFNDLGQIALQNVFSGFNVTILAYGQTGSGKSYCMMGPAADPGLIPRISKELFLRIQKQSSEIEGVRYTCEASYFEIYNEKVRDLLDPKKMDRVGSAGLAVREHPKHGPYVEDLSNIPVQSYEDVDNLLSQGNSGRTVAATRMNAESSRSHAIFSLKLKQVMTNSGEGIMWEKVAHIHLVDLAGSERQAKTKAQGSNLKEAAEINKSLVTLGRVISALAESNSGKKGTPSRATNHIPFRDSTLTWLLKKSFGIDGNSRTMLLCTVSSKSSDYEESLGSLRYASRAKKIITSAICNEDSNNKLVEGLKKEIKELTEKLGSSEKSSFHEIRLLSEQLQNAQKLIQMMNMSWEDKLKQAGQIRIERENALEREGIALQLDPCSPFFYSLRDDPGSGQCLIYYLKKGDTNIGRSPSLSQPCVLLHLDDGPEFFCVVRTMNDYTSILIPHDGVSQIFVNGEQVTQDLILSHGDTVLFGGRLSFRYSASMSFLQKHPQTRGESNWSLTDKEIQARLNSVMNDLEKERDQVKLLEIDAAENDAKYHYLVNELEVERANKADLSIKLKQAIEETIKTRRLLEGTESTHQRQLSKMKDLKREKLRGDLATIVARIHNDDNIQPIQIEVGNTISFPHRPTVEAIARVWRASTQILHAKTLEFLSRRINCCNSMAYALGHEVLFELLPNIMPSNLSPIPLLEASISVRMKNVTIPAICFSFAEFGNFYHKLKEFYCYSMERQDNRKDSMQLDPIEHSKANPLQVSAFAWGIMFVVSSTISPRCGNSSSILVFNGLGLQIGKLHLNVFKTEYVEDNKCAIMFEMIGIIFIDSNFFASYPISVSISCLKSASQQLSVLEFDDIPILQDLTDFNEERPTRSWVMEHSEFDGLNAPLQFVIKSGSLYPEHLIGNHELWNNAQQRIQSLKRVSVLRTPHIGADGSISFPGPSSRLMSARACIPTDLITGIQGGNGIGFELFTTGDVLSGTRIHVSVEIQELVPSSGSYSNCWTRRTEDHNILFKISLSKPKRFQVRILQADANHLTIESCPSLKVVAIRSGVLRDHTVFECDITQEQIHVHDRYLVFRCQWPSELLNHSYAQRNSTFELEIELSVYVDWQPEPIFFRHTLFCKVIMMASSRVGFFRNLMNNISHSKNPCGFFCCLQPIPEQRYFREFKKTVKSIQRKLRCKIDLERSRSHVDSSARFRKVVLDMMHDHGAPQPLKIPILPCSKVSISLCSELESQPERSGFLHQNQRRLFCVLRYPFLQLFKSAAQTAEDESVDLAGGSCHILENSQQPFTFKLQCKPKTYVMQASCEEDLQQWIRCLSMYMSSSS